MGKEIKLIIIIIKTYYVMLSATYIFSNIIWDHQYGFDVADQLIIKWYAFIRHLCLESGLIV
jgi:hypothetical protein